MSDRRTWRANTRVAHESLRDSVEGLRLVDGELWQVAVPVTDLCREPGGSRDSQLLAGHGFVVLETQCGWAFGYSQFDGYVGYVIEDALRAAQEMTHRVTARATHTYSAADMKSVEGDCLPVGAELSLEPAGASFWRDQDGRFVPVQHVVPLDHAPFDPVAVAEDLLGTPYLWGGASAFGIDCSGLTQLALRLAGIWCPRDSDQQEAAFPVIDGTPMRGDLVFWKGHVGMLIDPETLIHANAHHMAVAIEPFENAKTRIAAREFGDVTKIARPAAD